VKLIGFDDRGKVKLSMKRVDQATGEDISAQFDKPREPREPRSDSSAD
jgi:polyribonucleotide nucleotidyltransferase